MTAIRLAYGTSGLTIDRPDEPTVVVEPAYAQAADDERLEPKA
jgi:hypothetical protein